MLFDYTEAAGFAGVGVADIQPVDGPGRKLYKRTVIGYNALISTCAAQPVTARFARKRSSVTARAAAWRSGFARIATPAFRWRRNRLMRCRIMLMQSGKRFLPEAPARL